MWGWLHHRWYLCGLCRCPVAGSTCQDIAGLDTNFIPTGNKVESQMILRFLWDNSFKRPHFSEEKEREFIFMNSQPLNNDKVLFLWKVLNSFNLLLCKLKERPSSVLGVVSSCLKRDAWGKETVGLLSSKIILVLYRHSSEEYSFAWDPDSSYLCSQSQATLWESFQIMKGHCRLMVSMVMDLLSLIPDMLKQASLAHTKPSGGKVNPLTSWGIHHRDTLSLPSQALLINYVLPHSWYLPLGKAYFHGRTFSYTKAPG